MRSYTINLPRGLKVDVFDLPEALKNRLSRHSKSIHL